MSDVKPSSIKKASVRYTRDFLGASLLYALFVIGAALAIKRLDLPQPAVFAMALLPLLPALLMLRVYLVFMNAVDEFHRRMHGEAWVISAAVVGFGTFAYGFLEEWVGVPHLSTLWVFPALIAGWGLALCVVRLRYK